MHELIPWITIWGELSLSSPFSLCWLYLVLKAFARNSHARPMSPHSGLEHGVGGTVWSSSAWDVWVMIWHGLQNKFSSESTPCNHSGSVISIDSWVILHALSSQEAETAESENTTPSHRSSPIPIFAFPNLYLRDPSLGNSLRRSVTQVEVPSDGCESPSGFHLQ